MRNPTIEESDPQGEDLSIPCLCSVSFVLKYPPEYFMYQI